MAKKIRFPLEMADGVKVRTLEELQEHFDAEKAVAYFREGKLGEWLKDRYYNNETAALVELDRDGDATELAGRIAKILGVDLPEVEEIDIEEVERRKERLRQLKQFTDDPALLAKVDLMAFDQDDLYDLLDEDAAEIYLCSNRFTIPLQVKNKKYIGVKDAVALIKGKEPVDLAALGIEFVNVELELPEECKAALSVKEDKQAKREKRTRKQVEGATLEERLVNAARDEWELGKAENEGRLQRVLSAAREGWEDGKERREDRLRRILEAAHEGFGA